MWDWIKEQAKKATEFSEHYSANQAFVEQLLAHPGEQALNRLQAKISHLNDQAYQELAATLALMYATEQQNLQLLKSSDGFGEGFDAELWRIQAPTDARQQFVLNRMQALEALISFAQIFRMQSPSSDKSRSLGQFSDDEDFQTADGVGVNHSHHTHNPSKSAGIKRKLMNAIANNTDRKTVLKILGELYQIDPDEAEEIRSQLDEMCATPIRKIR